jgi:hypothetical protein
MTIGDASRALNDSLKTSEMTALICLALPAI